MSARPFTRSGLHRLECDGCAAYLAECRACRARLAERAFLARTAPELSPALIASIPDHELRDWQDIATAELMGATP